MTAGSIFRDAALARVGVEMERPEKDLKPTALKRSERPGSVGAPMRVQSCSKRAVYVCARQERVNNTAVEHPESRSEPGSRTLPARIG